MTAIFDQFNAKIGPGSTTARENCVVSLEMWYPNGWQYSVLTTIFKGFASLDNRTTGYQQSTYAFSGRMSAPSQSSSPGFIEL